MDSIIAFCIGFVIGFILVRIIFETTAVGILHMDMSDPDDNPYLFLELSKEVKDIYKKKRVILRILKDIS